MKRFSMVVFGLFVVGALAANFQHFMEYIQFVVVVVFIHNGWRWSLAFALSTAAGAERARPARRHLRDGHSELGPGLILIFNLFDGLGGMAIITAWWGIWHIVSGLTLATVLERRDPRKRAWPTDVAFSP
jgi:BASS family bile acid:Na+ symporter